MAKITLPDGRVVDNPFAEISEKAMEEKTTPTTTDVSSLGKATYSWAKPGALQVAPNTYNAKTLPYSGTQGVGLANYGWNESNIIDKINFSRKKFQEGDKSGGYKEIFENMGNWANKYSPELKSFLDSGQVSEGLNMDTVLQAADYGLRSSAQKQQNKQGFFDSAFGKILGTAATIGAGFLPGGQFLAPAVGAAFGGASGGLKGALLGGLSGYGAGQFGQGFKATSGTFAQKLGGGLRSLKPSFGNTANTGGQLVGPSTTFSSSSNILPFTEIAPNFSNLASSTAGTGSTLTTAGNTAFSISPDILGNFASNTSRVLSGASTASPTFLDSLKREGINFIKDEAKDFAENQIKDQFKDLFTNRTEQSQYGLQNLQPNYSPITQMNYSPYVYDPVNPEIKGLQKAFRTSFDLGNRNASS